MDQMLYAERSGVTEMLPQRVIPRNGSRHRDPKERERKGEKRDRRSFVIVEEYSGDINLRHLIISAWRNRLSGCSFVIPLRGSINRIILHGGYMVMITILFTSHTHPHVQQTRAHGTCVLPRIPIQRDCLPGGVSVTRCPDITKITMPGETDVSFSLPLSRSLS